MYRHLETERLSIRPIHTGDARFLLELVNSAGWLRFIGDRAIRDVDASRAYIQKILDTPRYFYSVMELRDSGEPVGILTLLYREEYDHPDLGFALLPAYEKNGFTFEAARSYLAVLVRESPPVEKVLGITLTENQNSIRLLQKLGFTFSENIVKDDEKLSIYERSVSREHGGTDAG